MIQRLLPMLAVFVLLHDTAGNVLYINPDTVMAVGEPFGHGGTGVNQAGAKLTSSSGVFFYVKEEPIEALRVINGGTPKHGDWCSGSGQGPVDCPRDFYMGKSSAAR